MNSKGSRPEDGEQLLRDGVLFRRPVAGGSHGWPSAKCSLSAAPCCFPIPPSCPSTRSLRGEEKSRDSCREETEDESEARARVCGRLSAATAITVKVACDTSTIAETSRDLVFMTTARLSDLSLPFKGEVRRSPEQSARQTIVRGCKFVRQRALDFEKTTVFCFLQSLSKLLFERGLREEGRFDVAARSETPSPAAKATNSNCSHHAVAQVK